MRADLHLHTNYSPDGCSSPQEVVDSAIAHGIDCICITDHGEVQGAVDALRYAFDKNLLVIPGIEILTSSGDVLGINVKKVIPNSLSIERTIEEIHKQGGIAIIPHPFGWPIGGLVGGWNKLAKLTADAIEIFNASVFFQFINGRASRFVQRYGAGISAGSDAHHADFIGRGYIEFQKEIRSEEDVLVEVRNKTVQAKGKPLTFWENLKNGSKVTFKDIIDYYRLKPTQPKK